MVSHCTLVSAFAAIVLVSLRTGVHAEEETLQDAAVIDLQDLLRNVSAALNRVSLKLDECNAWKDKERSNEKPKDCADLYSSGNHESGVYRIWPVHWEMTSSFYVYCDMKTDGGGWMVFQKRGDYGLPSDYFFKDWTSYKVGFGTLNTEFWMGNDRIFSLSNQDSCELRIDMEDLEGNRTFAKYGHFWIENEAQMYKLNVKGYRGNAGDSFSGHGGNLFSTLDKKNDKRVDGHNCSDLYKGGWWYNACHSSNLNGLNLRGVTESYAKGIVWKDWRGHYYSMATVTMKIRPRDFINAL